MTKQELRQYAKTKRKEIVNKHEKDLQITKNILNNPLVLKSKNILVYLSTPFEVDTFELISKLKDKNIYAPRIEKQEINFYKLDLNNLKMNKYHILEPLGTDKITNFQDTVILVPGLMFDQTGNRLGYGGGYYDKFLSNKSLFKIGICYQELLIPKLEVEEHDIKMDMIITEGKWNLQD